MKTIEIEESLRRVIKAAGGAVNRKAISEGELKELKKLFKKAENEKIAIVQLLKHRWVEGVEHYESDKKYFDEYVAKIIGVDSYTQVNRLFNAGEAQRRYNLPIGSTSENAMRKFREYQGAFKKEHGVAIPEDTLHSIVQKALELVDSRPTKITPKTILEAMKKLGVGVDESQLSKRRGKPKSKAADPKQPISSDVHEIDVNASVDDEWSSDEQPSAEGEALPGTSGELEAILTLDKDTLREFQRWLEELLSDDRRFRESRRKLVKISKSLGDALAKTKEKPSKSASKRTSDKSYRKGKSAKSKTK